MTDFEAFQLQDGELWCERVPLARIAQSVGTPAYVYSAEAIRARCRAVKTAFAAHPTSIFYAVKANANLGVLRTIFAEGLGADLVSVGELERALTAGLSPQKAVFSGVGKRDEELRRALEVAVHSINVESAAELERLAQLAAQMGRRAPVCLRVNPNIDAKTHPKIATGLHATKFGIPEEELPALLARMRDLPSLELIGLACHIGSQILDLAPMQAAAERMVKLALAARDAGFELRELDLGGGLGIQYHQERAPSFAEYAAAILPLVRRSGLALSLEPGRAIVGNAGGLLTSVILVKKTAAKHFVVFDAGMNDLMRPSLYDAFHDILPVRSPEPGRATVACDFVGPICETGDYLGLDRRAPLAASGELWLVKSAGAYASSMASQYNVRPRAPEILVDGSVMRVVRQREALTQLWLEELDALV